MKRIFFVLMFILVVSTGCTSMQQSVYTNESTPYGNKVYATGNAAVAAASVNTTSNCPSCAVSGNNNRSGHPRYNQNKQRSEAERLYKSATKTLSREISNSINDAIRDAFK
jgi:hypothetical protein